MHLFRKWFRVAKYFVIRPASFQVLAPVVQQRIKYIGWSNSNQDSNQWQIHEQLSVLVSSAAKERYHYSVEVRAPCRSVHLMPIWIHCSNLDFARNAPNQHFVVPESFLTQCTPTSVADAAMEMSTTITQTTRRNERVIVMNAENGHSLGRSIGCSMGCKRSTNMGYTDGSLKLISSFN